jgi:hypothetical protein
MVSSPEPIGIPAKHMSRKVKRKSKKKKKEPVSGR